MSIDDYPPGGTLRRPAETFTVRPQDEQFSARHEQREAILSDGKPPLERWDQTCAVPLQRPAETTAVPVNGGIAQMPVVRAFDTGANRDVDYSKYDYEGFLDPDVLERFAAYMHKNRHLRDGTIRDSDNWQKGIPLSVYMKSLLRHVMDLWRAHRNKVQFDHPSKLRDFAEEACCAIMFNAMGYLSQLLKLKRDVE